MMVKYLSDIEVHSFVTVMVRAWNSTVLVDWTLPGLVPNRKFRAEELFTVGIQIMEKSSILVMVCCRKLNNKWCSVSILLVLSQCKTTSANEEPRSSGNSEVSQTHLAISILIFTQTS